MSSIPNSAMPHAGTSNDNEDQKDANKKKAADKDGTRATIKKGATKLKNKAKEHPKTAIAAGAAVVAAAVGAAALGAKKAASSKSAGAKPKSKSADTKSDGRKSKAST